MLKPFKACLNCLCLTKVGLDIFFLAIISGASMNLARSLAPAVLSGVLTSLWLYWTATFIGTSIVALILRKKFMRPPRKDR